MPAYGRWRANLGNQQEDRGTDEWDIIAKGTADPFEAAKAAALFGSSEIADHGHRRLPRTNPGAH